MTKLRIPIEELVKGHEKTIEALGNLPPESNVAPEKVDVFDEARLLWSAIKDEPDGLHDLIRYIQESLSQPHDRWHQDALMKSLNPELADFDTGEPWKVDEDSGGSS